MRNLELPTVEFDPPSGPHCDKHRYDQAHPVSERRRINNGGNYDSTQNVGEPISGVPDEYIDAYKRTLRVLGVNEENVNRCAAYVADPLATTLRPQMDKTVVVESVTGDQAFTKLDDLVHQGKRVLSSLTRGLRTNDPRIDKMKTTNGNLARQLQDPIGIALKSIEEAASVTGITIKGSDIPSTTTPGVSGEKISASTQIPETVILDGRKI